MWTFRSACTAVAVVLAACANRSASPAPSNMPLVSAAPSGELRLRWEPDLLSLTVDARHTSAAARLRACGEVCVDVAEYPPGRVIAMTVESPDRQQVVVVQREVDEGWQLDVIDVTRSKRRWSTAVGDGFDPDRGSTRVQWVRGERVLVTWGAGTYAAEGELFGDGRQLLAVSAAAIEVSPDLRFLATFAPAGAPRTESPSVYSTATGARLWSGAPTHVIALKWNGDDLRVDQPNGTEVDVDLRVSPGAARTR